MPVGLPRPAIAFTAMYGMALCIVSASHAFADTVRLKIVKSLAPGKSIELMVPKEYVSPDNKISLTNGGEVRESLYLVFRIAPAKGNIVDSATPQDLRNGAPGLTHLFLRAPVHPHQVDIGKWYLDVFLKQAKRKGFNSEPQQLLAGVSKYEISGPANEVIWTYKDVDSKVITIRCFLATCNSYRTWKGVVVAEYRYHRPTVDHFREVDAFIEKLLSEAYKKAR